MSERSRLGRRPQRPSRSFAVDRYHIARAIDLGTQVLGHLSTYSLAKATVATAAFDTMTGHVAEIEHLLAPGFARRMLDWPKMWRTGAEVKAAKYQVTLLVRKLQRMLG